MLPSCYNLIGLPCYYNALIIGKTSIHINYSTPCWILNLDKLNQMCYPNDITFSKFLKWHGGHILTTHSTVFLSKVSLSKSNMAATHPLQISLIQGPQSKSPDKLTAYARNNLAFLRARCFRSR